MKDQLLYVNKFLQYTKCMLYDDEVRDGISSHYLRRFITLFSPASSLSQSRRNIIVNETIQNPNGVKLLEEEVT